MSFAIQERYYHPLSAWYRTFTNFAEPLRRGAGVCKSLGSLTKGSLYLAGAGIFRLLCIRNLASHLFSQGFYHAFSGATSLYSTYHFGRRLVTSSCNLPKYPTLRYHFNRLAELYPTHTTSEGATFRIGSRNFSKKEFSRNHWRGGICRGICTDFFSHYFRSSLPPSEAFLETARRYTQGGSEKAVFSQYLYASNVDAKYSNPAITLYNNLRFQSSGKVEAIDQLFSQTASISSRSRRNLEEHLSHLPEGIYRVHIDGRSANGCSRFLFGNNHGHSLIYYKSSERSFSEMSFLFDPNFGTVRLSQNDHVSGFMEALSAYHPIVKWEKMTFFKAFSRNPSQ